MYEFCERHGVRHERCGKVIVARNEGELPRLDELERRGRANGVPGLRRLDAAGLRELEPHAAGVAALHSPHTGDRGLRRRRAGAGAPRRRSAVSTWSPAARSRRVEERRRGRAARATRAARHGRGARCSAPGPGRTGWRWRPGAPADPRIVPVPRRLPEAEAGAAAAGALADLPGARPEPAVPGRAPEPPRGRRGAARARRRCSPAPATPTASSRVRPRDLARDPRLAGQLAAVPALLAHRPDRDPARG